MKKTVLFESITCVYFVTIAALCDNNRLKILEIFRLPLPHALHTLFSLPCRVYTLLVQQSQLSHLSGLSFRSVRCNEAATLCATMPHATASDRRLKACTALISHAVGERGRERERKRETEREQETRPHSSSLTQNVHFA